MIFLQETDLLPQIETSILNAITPAQKELILSDIELSSISEMESYLSTRYDTGLIFTPAVVGVPTDDTRNRLIVMYLVDIMVYHITARIIPKQVPEIRGIRYEAAINWLKMVSKGQLNPDLPPITTTETPKNFNWGSQTLKSR
ncbi:MAG: hypothetical protein COZ16_12280 [Flavobacteriaceae bacterium CG_4_10_14_3_um_filter_31_253]|nr:MAG: hypothetical protein COZ16_12280 [Flavobacteriaceae bacterium CG_4_10_14_3_um_filter_31_253]